MAGFAPWGWVIGSGIYLDDIAVAFRGRALAIGALALAIIAASLFLSMVISRHLTKPLGSLSKIMHRLAEGDTSAPIPEMDRKDEFGDMAKAVSFFKDNQIRVAAMAQEQAREQAEKEERHQKVSRYIAEFEVTVMSILDGLAHAESSMRRAAVDMKQGADDTKNLSVSVASAAEQSSGNVATVASAAEELSASINEISQQVLHSAAIAGRAVEMTDGASAQIHELEGTVSQIGDIVDLINDIAAQTNLLALNATIEAARAGEAGKGFAVVANEVKNLANQTAKATEEISQQISRVQNSTDETVRVIQEITNVIGEISSVVTSVSSAVEEQGAATQEIARNVEQASYGSQLVTDNIHQVMGAAERASQISNEIGYSSQEISEQAGQLRQNVDSFMERVRAADMGSKDVLMVWNSNLEINHDLIDAQHKELVDTINDLFRALVSKSGHTEVERAFQVMMNYTRTHLADEEALMEAKGFPELEKHTKQHRGLMTRLDDIYAKYRGGDVKAGDELLNFLANWWTSHIATSDMRFVVFMKKAA